MEELELSEKHFQELFNLHYKELCRIVFPILKSKDTAEDVVQDVFVKFWLRKTELQDVSNYRAYLYKSVVYRALDYIRKEKTERLFKDELKIVHSQFQDADATLEEKELRDAIETGIQKMPDQMQIIFHLSRFSSLKNREIAEELKISIKTVESNVTKALKILSEHLSHFSKNPSFKTLFWLSMVFLLK
jgi:RNA polymerase sigma-70 factor (ECF subfamily)